MTVDENEVHRLGLLLEQTFPVERIQILSSVINRKAVARQREFGRSDEYIFVVYVGDAGPSPVELTAEWRLGDPARRASRDDIQWVKLRRVGTGAARKDSPGCFYPLLIEQQEDHAQLVAVGDALPISRARSSVEIPGRWTAVWPLRADGSEGRWQMTPEKLRSLLPHGYVRLGPFRQDRTAVYYLPAGEQARVEAGAFIVTGRRSDGSVIVDSEAYVPSYVPSTHWNIAAHNASEHGTRLNMKLIPGRRFPFPKSLYAVEDTLRFFVKDKPDAVVLDFFAGSGTTAHAVTRLNRQDGGRRQSIMVTNNEVSADEASRSAQARTSARRPGVGGARASSSTSPAPG